MKQFLAKYLFLSYHSKIAGKDVYFLRATTVIVPVFCIAIIATLLFPTSLIFWLVFTALILLTFPIVKSRWINWISFVVASVLIILAPKFDYAWWEPIPMFFFSLGIFMDRTKFLFFSIKYSDLQDWEQKLQYLYIPEDKTPYDETEPEFEERKKVIAKLEELKEMEYGAKDNANLIPLLIPIASTVLMIIILFIFREHVESFPDIRGF